MNPRAAAGAATTWNCWYDGAMAVYCLLDMPVAASADRDPMDRHLPPLVQAIRHDPTSIDGPVAVPLRGIPFDTESMRRLVGLVMCGRQPSCSIRIEGNNLPRPVVAENRRVRR